MQAICQSLSVQDIKLTRGSLSFAILAAEVVVLGASACHVARLRDVDHPSHILGILRAQGKIQKMHAEIRSAWEKDEDWVKILKTLWHRNEEEHKKAAQAIIEIAWKYLWDGKE
ncbi:hypothetical protein NEOLEDRAFT_1147593 [Neolentinus lepideus HHB14362 ss-1]|uniref:Uncharacterized protein n=1 Tax=Neolentinus lepideus HHB14362 ss-1 TaxID=1314782 RepID=A0A165SXX8_9AGAM|nr:hypothetical protein NEOLEDRAFT_1147593 [Neolentinus lepideus HHB14362 ss-1]